MPALEIRISAKGIDVPIDREIALAAREFTTAQKFVDLTFDCWTR